MAKLIEHFGLDTLVHHKNGKRVFVKSVLLIDDSKYDGAALRKIRKERGVGRPPKRG